MMLKPNNLACPASATTVVGARELHMEILDTATRKVWQSVEPVIHIFAEQKQN